MFGFLSMPPAYRITNEVVVIASANTRRQPILATDGCFQEIQRLVPDDRKIGKLLARVRQELTSPPKVEVPDLSGQTLSQARSSLSSKGLELSVNEEVPSDTLAEGEIIEQSPEPETEVLAGSSVSVTVSS